ncbi:MAG: hypothetical protein ACW97X_14255, partial [Candidatus Hodarchaeales archaeon]
LLIQFLWFNSYLDVIRSFFASVLRLSHNDRFFSENLYSQVYQHPLRDNPRTPSIVTNSRAELIPSFL